MLSNKYNYYIHKLSLTTVKLQYLNMEVIRNYIFILIQWGLPSPATVTRTTIVGVTAFL